MSDSIKRVVFISGKITDDKNYIKKFANAEKKLNDLGYAVLNPTKSIPFAVGWEKAMNICYEMIKASDAIYLLSDWNDSKGAMLEHKMAVDLNKEIMHQK